MIKSMTGFGRAETVDRERKITVELKSVNHRYLDLSIKMPRKLNFLEGAVRNLLKTYMQRGKAFSLLYQFLTNLFEIVVRLFHKRIRNIIHR